MSAGTLRELLLRELILERGIHLCLTEPIMGYLTMLGRLMVCW